MSPYWLVSGLTPAQGAATGAFMATGMSVSSVAALHQTGHFPGDKRLLIVLSGVAGIASIAGACIVPKLDILTFRHVLAVITICALPLIYVKPRAGFHLGKNGNIGLALAIIMLAAGSIITSSAFSILFALTLMAFFDMTVLQMTALRRVIGVVQSVVLLAAFSLQGYFVWQHAVAGFIGGSIGSYIGTRHAAREGEGYAKSALAVMSLIGALALIAS